MLLRRCFSSVIAQLTLSLSWWMNCCATVTIQTERDANRTKEMYEGGKERTKWGKCQQIKMYRRNYSYSSSQLLKVTLISILIISMKRLPWCMRLGATATVTEVSVHVRCHSKIYSRSPVSSAMAQKKHNTI